MSYGLLLCRNIHRFEHAAEEAHRELSPRGSGLFGTQLACRARTLYLSILPHYTACVQSSAVVVLVTGMRPVHTAEDDVGARVFVRVLERLNK